MKNKIISAALIMLSSFLLISCNTSKNTSTEQIDQKEITDNSSSNKEENKTEISTKDGYDKYKNGSLKNSLIFISGTVQLITDVSIDSTKLYMLYIKDKEGNIDMYLIQNDSLEESKYKDKNIEIDGLVLGSKQLDYYPISITTINIT